MSERPRPPRLQVDDATAASAISQTGYKQSTWWEDDADGRDHWPYCFTSVVAGAGVKRGHVHGLSDETASAPVESPVHPNDLLATIYHALGIDPHTMVMNHLNQPRELVQGEPVLELFA